MLETQRELDVMQLALYLGQAENALEHAAKLYKIAFPNETRFYTIDLNEIAGYVTKAKKAIRYECEEMDRRTVEMQKPCSECGLIEGCHTSDCPNDPDPVVIQDDGSGNQVTASGRVLR